MTYANLTPEVAYSFAYPVASNKSLNSFIDSKKPLTKLGKVLKVGSKSEKEIADYMLKNRNPKDSFLSVSDRLSDIGLNKTAFFSHVKDLYNEGKLQDLTTAQEHEIESNLSPRASLGDIYYKSLWLKNPWRQNAK